MEEEEEPRASLVVLDEVVSPAVIVMVNEGKKNVLSFERSVNGVAGTSDL